MKSYKSNYVNSSKILFRCDLDTDPTVQCSRILELPSLMVNRIKSFIQSGDFILHSLAQIVELHEFLGIDSIEFSGTFEGFATDLILDFNKNTLSVIIYGVARDSVSEILMGELECISSEILV